MSLLKVQRLAVGVLLANCFIIETPEKSGIIIDPGSEPERIINYIDKNNITPKQILLTHGHFDHINAAAALKEKYNIPVAIHEKDECMLSDPDKALAHFVPGLEFCSVTADRILEDGDLIKVDGIVFETFHTPGHSAGSVCYICGDEIFAGDTIFCGSVGRTDEYSGDPAEQVKSLKRLTSLPGDYTLYCGHGENTTLDWERENNPFLPK